MRRNVKRKYELNEEQTRQAMSEKELQEYLLAQRQLEVVDALRDLNDSRR